MSPRPIAMRDALLHRILESMATDDRVFFISADFGSPVLDKIREQFPKRFVNVGIAEQNLINVSAGLALEGYTVFAYAIAPFITMRCYEQTRVNLALLSEVRPMNVNLIGVGAGYSYVVSGPTHQCYEDLSIMRAMPNMGIYSPADHHVTAALFDTFHQQMGPKYIRLDAQVLPTLYDTQLPNIEQGFHLHRTGTTGCIIATGYMVHTALAVADRLSEQGINLSVIDLFNLSSFNEQALCHELAKYSHVVSLEEGFKGRGGMDAMLFHLAAKHELPMRMQNLGVEGTYRFELGSRTRLHEQVGIGENIVTEKVCAFIGEKTTATT